MHIERIENGFMLRYCDPELEAMNRKSKHWVDTERAKSFPDEGSLLAGIKEMLPTLKQIQDDKIAYAEAFDEAAGEE